MILFRFVPHRNLFDFSVPFICEQEKNFARTMLDWTTLQTKWLNFVLHSSMTSGISFHRIYLFRWLCLYTTYIRTNMYLYRTKKLALALLCLYIAADLHSYRAIFPIFIFFFIFPCSFFCCGVAWLHSKTETHIIHVRFKWLLGELKWDG